MCKTLKLTLIYSCPVVGVSISVPGNGTTVNIWMTSLLLSLETGVQLPAGREAALLSDEMHHLLKGHQLVCNRVIHSV